MNSQIPLKIRLQIKKNFLILKINEKPAAKFKCAIELELEECWQWMSEEKIKWQAHLLFLQTCRLVDHHLH